MEFQKNEQNAYIGKVKSASTAYDRFYKERVSQIFLKRLTRGTTSVEMSGFPNFNKHIT
jgi:hypothetical protein